MSTSTATQTSIRADGRDPLERHGTWSGTPAW